MRLLVAITFVLGILFFLSILIDKIRSIRLKHRKIEDIRISESHEPKALVVAGSYYQFYEWCFANNLNREDYIYATEHSVQGIRLPIIRVGTWLEQSEELLRHLRNMEIESTGGQH